jgi:SAM-dependent methyltransferase
MAKNIHLFLKTEGFYQRHKAIIIKFFTFLFFLILSTIILRDIFFSSSFIGFNHDWDFPMTNVSLKNFCIRSLFVWSDGNAGYPFVYPAENLYRYLLFPLSFLELSGLIVIQLILLLVFTFGGYFMYSLLRNSFKLSYFPSLISGFFYATTPVIFNKVAAGHIPYIIAYALSPLILAFFIKYTTTRETKNLIITSLLLAFATIQIQFAIMLTLLFFLYAILIAKMKIGTLIKTFSFMILLVSLVHMFWLLPSLNSASFLETLQGASSIENLRTWGTSFINAFRMVGYRSPHFEIALSNFSYKYLWDIASLAIVFFSFGSLLIKKSRINLFFAGISLITLIFTTVAAPFSTIVYFLYSAFPIFNVFREVYHLAFLIAFSYSIMLAFFLQAISKSKKLKTRLKGVTMIVIFGIVIMNNPFIYSGDFSGQVQKYQLDDQSLSIINGYIQSDGDYRVLYMPLLLPFKYDDLTYHGIDPMIAYSQKSTVGNYVNSDFLNRIAIAFYLPSSNLTNILSILSVKYAFFRNNLQSMLPLYLNEGRLPIGNGSYDIRPIWTNDNLLQTLTNQQNLDLLRVTENLSIFETKGFLPHIYTATIPIAVEGSTDKLFTLLLSSPIDNLDSKAIFLSEQLNPEQWELVKNNNETISIDEKIITTQPYSDQAKPFNWTTMPNDTIEIRYYDGWKSVIRTDGQENETSLSFASLDACPYEFPSLNASGWDALDSTLIYIKNSNQAIRIDQIFENGEPLTNIIGIWWETDWQGMGTKTVNYPIVIPPNQRAIIQVGDITNGTVTFQSLTSTTLSSNQIDSDKKPEITYKKVNPTRYEVKIENASDPFFIVFNENYSPQWNAYGQDEIAEFSEVTVNYPNLHVAEVNHEEQFTPQDASYLFKRSLDEKNHFSANGYANAWYIDPAQIDKNEDGSFAITIYFLPQSYFYLGLVISTLTLAVCLGYLLLNWKLRKNKGVTIKDGHPADWGICKKEVTHLNLSESSRILDIGSKDGKKAHFCIDKGNLLMSDISKKNLSPFVLSDATSLPYKDNLFDLVTLFHVLEHIKNDKRALREIHRVLKNNGTALIVTPNANRFTIIFSYALRIVSRSPHKYPLNPDHVFEYSASDIESVMKNSEFQSYRIEPIFMRISRILRIRKYCDQWLIVVKK